MFATRTSFIQRLLYQLNAYSAIFIGVTSYRYDFVHRQYSNSKWTKLIANLANLFVLVFIPSDLYRSWSAAFELDLVTELTIRLDTTTNGIMCLLYVLQRVQRERATNRIYQQLRQMQRTYRYRRIKPSQSKELQQRLDHIYVARNCIMWLLGGLLFGFMWLTNEHTKVGSQLPYPLVKTLLLLGYVLAMQGQIATKHLHFLVTWRICWLYMSINARLKQLIGQESCNERILLLELQHLRWQHSQLAQHMQQFNAAYNLILLSSRFALIVTAAALGYYMTVNPHRDEELHRYFLAISVGLYIAIALDFYILDVIYDLTVSTHRETSWLLRGQNELRLANGSEQLAKTCELFALQIVCLPLKFKPFGLFVSGKATWLSNVACIVSWMIVLLQYRMLTEISG